MLEESFTPYSEHVVLKFRHQCEILDYLKIKLCKYVEVFKGSSEVNYFIHFDNNFNFFFK
jgi:hypothetical protein